MGCSQSSDVSEPPPPTSADTNLRASTPVEHARGTIKALFTRGVPTLSGAVDGWVVVRAEGKRHFGLDYAALTRASSKDQDRFICLPRGSAGLMCAICDGHSVHSNSSGQQHAEAAARWLGTDLWRRVHDKLSAPEAGTANQQPCAALCEATTASFLEHQRRCEARYAMEVSDKLLEQKHKMEEELGEELTLELPQEGGTTATMLVVHSYGLLVAWVGDSRAILAFEDADGQLQCSALTTDHNTLDEAEKQRLIASGGKTGKDSMSSHVFVGDAEGGLKVTRSLGDSPFHKDDAVSAAPGLRHVPISPKTRFAVIASDGIWDHLSNVEVMKTVSEAIAATRAQEDLSATPSPSSQSVVASQGSSEDGRANSPRPNSPSSPSTSKPRLTKKRGQSAAAAACAAVLDRIQVGQQDGTLGSGVDDRAVAVIVLNRPS